MTIADDDSLSNKASWAMNLVKKIVKKKKGKYIKQKNVKNDEKNIQDNWYYMIKSRHYTLEGNKKSGKQKQNS